MYICAAAVTLSLAWGASAVPLTESTTLDPDAFISTLSVDSIVSHLEAFSRFSQAAGGNRAHGTAGYDASADYVAAFVQDAGLQISRQPVHIEMGEVQTLQLVVDGTVYEAPTIAVPFFAATTVAGGVTGELITLPGSGCQPEEFAGTEGKVVLMRRKIDGCAEWEREWNSFQAGNLAIILYDDLPPAPNGYVEPTNSGVVSAVTLLTDTTIAQELIGKITNGPVDALVNVQINNVMVPGDNVLAQTKWGNQDEVIMFGAHLDSVEAGPGINDNGSGAATLLEMVSRLREVTKAKHAVRFAFWAAEEHGLVGSRHYVEQLTQSERDQIVAYINLDMTGSPNYRLGVQDNSNATGTHGPRAPPVPAGSIAIERILQHSFESIGQTSVPIELSRSSDHTYFMVNGIPACYLASGASGLKTPAEAELFGGVAGQPYDSCYHKECDGLNNVSRDALIYNARAAGRALAILANDISAIEEEQNAAR